MSADRYFDAASSEPLHPAARDAMLAALDQGYADPRRLHGPARNARLILDNAREVVAEALGVRSDEVSFTSSGTDAVPPLSELPEQPTTTTPRTATTIAIPASTLDPEQERRLRRLG